MHPFNSLNTELSFYVPSTRSGARDRAWGGRTLSFMEPRAEDEGSFEKLIISALVLLFKKK